MVASASDVFGVNDRRDQMVFGMTTDAARVKEKSREARRKGICQVGHRGVRYQQFQGRRGKGMEEEIRTEVHARRAKSIQLMARLLEEKERANAEEGTPRESLGGDEGEPVEAVSSVPLVELVEPGQRLMSGFFRRQ